MSVLSCSQLSSFVCFVWPMSLKRTFISVLPDSDKLFEHDLGALNLAALNRRVERAGLLSNLGPCCKALCARRDFAIRRQLLKNDKVDVMWLLTEMNLLLVFCFNIHMRLDLPAVLIENVSFTGPNKTVPYYACGRQRAAADEHAALQKDRGRPGFGPRTVRQCVGTGS